ncbi:MAG TPA: flavodoxin [Patescibacteria group bacterium]
MKILVTFYSKTGNTRRAANEIAKYINADIDEIIDLESRKGIIGWFKSGRDEVKGYKTEIKTNRNPGDYDLVIIGTPVWAWASTPAVRTYAEKFKDKLNKVAVFSTSGDTVPEKPKLILEKILGKEISTCTGWTSEEIKNKKIYQEKMENFIEALKKNFDL